MKKNLSIGFILLSLLTLSISCMSKKKAVSENGSLTGSAWTLQSVKDFEMEQLNKPATINFNAAEGRVNGFGGCNGFGGPYTLEGDKLKFGMLIATKMYCNIGSKTEDAYMAALSKVDHYKIENGQLQLLQGATVLLSFKDSGDKK